MKKHTLIILLLLTCSILFSCGKALDPKYEALIDAIENGSYSDARQELDKLMKNEQDENGKDTSNNHIETECPHDYEVSSRNEPSCNYEGNVNYRCKLCGNSYAETLEKTEHIFGEATCTKESRCEKCNTKGADKLGHTYEKGYCTRCNEDDPEMLKKYNHAVEQIKYYTDYGYIYTYEDRTYVTGHPGGKHLYELFQSLGDYKDSKEHLARFTVLEDRITSYVSTKTDNLGNVTGPSTTVFQEYDANGNIIFTIDSDFMEYYGIMATSNYSAYVFYDENNVVNKIHIHFVKAQIDTIVTPIYNDDGVLVATEIRTNTKNETLNFKYNEKGERIYAETYDVWYQSFSARTYTYNEQGKLLEKHAYEGVSQLPDSFDDKKMKLVHKNHYDENGKLQGASPIEYSNDILSYEVDANGRITKCTSRSETAVTVNEYVYEDCYIYTAAQ